MKQTRHEKGRAAPRRWAGPPGDPLRRGARAQGVYIYIYIQRERDVYVYVCLYTQ